MIAWGPLPRTHRFIVDGFGIHACIAYVYMIYDCMTDALICHVVLSMILGCMVLYMQGYWSWVEEGCITWHADNIFGDFMHHDPSDAEPV